MSSMDTNNIRYYVIAYVPCPECGGTHQLSRNGPIVITCPDCNEQGEVEVRVPLVEALREVGACKSS